MIEGDKTTVVTKDSKDSLTKVQKRKLKKKEKEEEEKKEPDLTDGKEVVQKNRYIKFLTQILDKKCRKCDSLKPPQSHHCSTCEACVARMDHHCPWVNNCVGFYNQKFFL